MPFLQSKQAHIQVALEFREQIRNTRTISLGKGYGSRQMLTEEIDAREELYLRMKQLNDRTPKLDE